MKKKTTFVPTHRNGYIIRSLKNVNRSAVLSDIYITNYPIEKCLKCGLPVNSYSNYIPIDENDCVIIKGKCCPDCKVFFEENGDKLLGFLKSNRVDSVYKFSTYYMFPDYVRSKKYFKRLDSALVMAFFKSVNENKYISYMIVQDINDISEEKRIVHYAVPESRYVLTGLMLKNRTFLFEGEEYELLSSITHEGISFLGDADIFLKQIQLISNRSVYTKRHALELVQMLLYSAYTKKFELIAVWCDIKTKELFVDVSTFKQFVRKCGKPMIDISFRGEYTSEHNFGVMKDESLLFAYGYSVSATKGNTTEKRHKILSEILDLQLMSKNDIINLLEHNMKMHSGEKFANDRKRWEFDIKFVGDYSVDPNRFTSNKSIR